ncbi:hypothetical protein [Marinobacter salexigens]|uniref:Uncharacterized protein n=1 Tax=Marinobacter salexigens TaxID=1925763 RepID=A0ABS6A711_9GAMM|nr:hypothetical protein [Marinobacter salexigens]MBU2873975.1 hypothetical protein [Marinobacter salexigens]
MTTKHVMPFAGYNYLSADDFERILELFSLALAQLDPTDAWGLGDTQLMNAKQIIHKFYGDQSRYIPSLAIEMFNERLIGNIRNDKNGRMTHSHYQPNLLMQYATEVADWGLVTGVISVPIELTHH